MGRRAGECGDQAEFQQFARFDPGVQEFEGLLVVAVIGRDETEGVGFGQDLVEADKGAAADEQDVRGVDVLAVVKPHRRAFHHLEQGMLDAFAEGGVGFAASRFQFVDLINEKNAAFESPTVVFPLRHRRAGCSGATTLLLLGDISR